MHGCSFNTDLPSSATNLGAVQSRPRRRGRAATKEKLASKEKAPGKLVACIRKGDFFHYCPEKMLHHFYSWEDQLCQN